MSSFPKNIGCPLKCTTAPSVLILVLVLLLLNIIATVCLARAFRSGKGSCLWALMAAFASAERLTRLTSSVLVRSLIDRKCRGTGIPRAAVCIERSLVMAILVVFLEKIVRLGEKEGTVRTEPRERVRSVDAIMGGLFLSLRWLEVFFFTLISF